MYRFPTTFPAVLTHGFRPFFLVALTFAVCVIPYWLLVFFGLISLRGPLGPVDWHIHEMVFGYVSAVIAGFLFTAIPNWTGRAPINGWPLTLLVCLWLLGRVAVLGFGGLSHITVMLVDCSFIAAVLFAAVFEVVAGKNWRNLVVVAPISLYLAANVVFHFEVINSGTADYGRRLGLAVVVFLITLIGGRIIPAFTRNWLVKQNGAKLPTPFNKFDRVCVLGGAGAMLAWVWWPDDWKTGVVLIGAAALHAIRLCRWRGALTLPSPLLFILHVAYAFVPMGFLVLGAGHGAAGFHVLGIGAVGGMTVAVMIRASAGHTGRALTMNRGVLVGFSLLPLAALVRAFASISDGLFQEAVILSALLWVLGFALVLVTIGPWLLAAKKT